MFEATLDIDFGRTFAQMLGGAKALYNPDFTLTWDFLVNEETEIKEFATSNNPLYVTYSDPISGTKLYHTVVHTGCAVTNNGVGISEQNVFNAIWGDFVALSIPKVNLVDGEVVEGETLTYYGKDVEADSEIEKANIENELKSHLIIPDDSQNPDNYSSLARQYANRYNSLIFPSCEICWHTEGLLQKTDGTCGAWKNFALDVFKAQGIEVHGYVIQYRNSNQCFKVKSDVPGQGTDVPRENV